MNSGSSAAACPKLQRVGKCWKTIACGGVVGKCTSQAADKQAEVPRQAGRQASKQAEILRLLQAGRLRMKEPGKDYSIA